MENIQQALRCGHVMSVISGLLALHVSEIGNRKSNITMASSSMSDCWRTMIFKLKYVSSNDVALHTENSKTELDLKRNPTDFYVDFVEAGSTKRVPFVLRTKEQVEML